MRRCMDTVTVKGTALCPTLHCTALRCTAPDFPTDLRLYHGVGVCQNSRCRNEESGIRSFERRITNTLS